jgi:hypothetical protein
MHDAYSTHTGGFGGCDWEGEGRGRGRGRGKDGGRGVKVEAINISSYEIGFTPCLETIAAPNDQK